MEVTAWNNGAHHSTGNGYGLKVDIKDRDKYFRKDWKNALLELEGEPKEITVNVDKSSFWDPTCRELISKEIGIWLIKNGKAPWPKGCPPKMRMEHIGDARFKVRLI